MISLSSLFMSAKMKFNASFILSFREAYSWQIDNALLHSNPSGYGG